MEDYIGAFEEVDDHRSGKIVIQLTGRLNKTGCINPRYNVQLRDMEKWVVKLLPSRQFGYIVLTTSAGIVSIPIETAHVLIGHRWTMRRRGGSMWLARFWASSTRRLGRACRLLR